MRRRFQWLLVGAIFLACIVYLDIPSVVRTLESVPPLWLVSLLVLMTIDRILMAWKWTGLLRALHIQIPFRTVIGYYYQGNLAGVFLPTGLGGDLLRAHLVSRRYGHTPQIFASLFMEKIIGFVSAVSWAAIGALVIAWYRFGDMKSLWIGLALGGVMVVGVAFLGSLHPRVVDRVLLAVTSGPRGRIKTFVHRLIKAYAQFGQCRHVLILNGMLTILEHGLQLVVYVVMAKSLGIHMAVIPFIAITALFLLLYRLPISPDGWGVGEVAAIGLYGIIDISPENAFAMAFLGHVLQTLVVLPGLWFIYRSVIFQPSLPMEKSP
ncbi:MAG: UPF0104 family protein [Nitrospirae bacterium]|nr:MAG: UPF0104 family protein [Nitrospirota bacterium]